MHNTPPAVGERSFAVGIPAAGLSRRLGVPKLCLPWCYGVSKGDVDASVLSHLIRTWCLLGAQRIVVVHGGGAHPVAEELDRVLQRFPEWGDLVCGVPTLYSDRDMYGSVQTVAHQLLAESETNAGGCSTHHCRLPVRLILSPGDQPHLQFGALQRLMDVALLPEHASGIVRARYQGRGGHPVSLPSVLLPRLAESTHPTLKHFLAAQVPEGVRISDVECGDPGLLLDIDTPGDLDAALRLACADKVQSVLRDEGKS
ncbi:hypothetical protein DB346_14765 [Verrucomicrobia bacterium LW23]|nr:hypothetical protein DB346_14765 [Verrucomicrobia bacterium LW23]